ncbi:MAG: response regulator [Cyclobacteriaceae bacterium]
MTAIRILVAEDNPMHASKMEMVLDEMGYEVLAITPSEEEFLRLFRATKPDLIILDIELSDAGDGVQIAARVKEIKPTPTIFATSFEDKETINRALQTDPYAYIVKPVEKPSLQAAIELALFKFSKAGQTTKPESPTSWDEDLILKDSFFIKAGGKLVKVRFEDILWIQVGQDRYCEIITSTREFQVRTSMNDLEQKLDPTVFVRIHRSHIVNIHKVDGIDDIDMVVEVEDQSLPLGGSYKSNLINRFRLL